MARVTEEPLDVPEWDDYDDWQDLHEAEQELLDSIEDPLIRFPRADGYALYRVVDMTHIEECDCCGRGGEPLLQHVPVGDGWRAMGSTINGLTTGEAKRRAEQ